MRYTSMPVDHYTPRIGIICLCIICIYIYNQYGKIIIISSIWAYMFRPTLIFFPAFLVVCLFCAILAPVRYWYLAFGMQNWVVLVHQASIDSWWFHALTSLDWFKGNPWKPFTRKHGRSQKGIGGVPLDVPLNILTATDGMFNRHGMMIVDLQPGSGNIPANGGAPSSNPEIEKLISKLGAQENSP